jgi:predicted TPR repeat methyltransferase
MEEDLTAIRHRIGELLKMKQFSEAEPLLAALLQATPDDIQTLNRMALVFEHTDRKTDAISCTQHVLSLDPTNPYAQSRLQRLGAAPPHRPSKHVSVQTELHSGVWTL